MKSLLGYFLCTLCVSSLLLLTSCATNDLTISVTEPAPVDIPAYVDRVAIINRSMPSEGNEKLDVMDKVLSLEGKNFDEDGARQAVEGLYNALLKNSEFTEIKIVEHSQINNPGLGIFPAPLSWEEVEKICEENDVDAVFVLSLYDTEANANYGAAKKEVNVPFVADLPVIEHQLTIRTLVKTGWRIYEPQSRLILDEFVINDTQVSQGRGINPANAAKAVIGRKEAVMQISNIIGESYSTRILPYYNRVWREYYVKGTNNFKVGKRRAQTGDWNGAAELWAKEVDNPKRKIAGRACYNMAIISEINGDKDTALEWASKSYADYNNKEALDYIRILKNRMARDQRLANQTQ